MEVLIMKRDQLPDEAAKVIRDSIHNLIYVQSLLEVEDERQESVDEALFQLMKIDPNHLDDCQ
jgi:hypothetical protein